MRSDARLTLGSGVTHQWLLQVPDPKLEVVALAAELVKHFGEALHRGAFWAGGSAAPRCISQLRVLPKGIEWSYELIGCDVRYARLLRNGLYALEKITESPLVLRATQLPDVDDVLELRVDAEQVAAGKFYPARPPRLPFSFDERDSQRADQSRRMLVEFSSPIDTAKEQILASTADLWERIARFGYAPAEASFAAGDFVISAVGSSVFDEYAYEIVVDTFRAPEVAWASLLNLLAGFSSNLRCSRVELT